MVLAIEELSVEREERSPFLLGRTANLGKKFLTKL
jgi:hypothetical protein